MLISVQEIRELHQKKKTNKHSQLSLARNELKELLFLLWRLYMDFVLRKSTCVGST